jgi:hypothetical protein
MKRSPRSLLSSFHCAHFTFTQSHLPDLYGERFRLDTMPFEVWRADKPYPGLIFPDIEEGARWTVVENDKEGPVIKRWEPFPDHLQQWDVSHSSFPRSTSF